MNMKANILSGVAFLLAGCAIGNHYGYQYDATTNSSKTSPQVYSNFEGFIGSFLKYELKKCGNENATPKPLHSSDYYMEYKVRQLRGCVIPNGSWELIQIAFIRTAENGGDVKIIVDGWVAPGLIYPPDAQFTRHMEPEFSGYLQDFTRTLTNDFRLYRQDSTIQEGKVQ